MKKTMLRTGYFLAASLLLSGCAYHRYRAEPTGTLARQEQIEKSISVAKTQLGKNKVALAKEQGILSHLQKNSLLLALTDEEVDVLHIGQTYRIALRSDNLFQPDSANFQSDYINSVMPLITKLITQYGKVNVEVIGFSDDVGQNTKRSFALTDAQAQAVASQLWSRHINARIIYAKGGGMTDPVATNSTPEGRSSNRRVEIRFRYFAKGMV